MAASHMRVAVSCSRIPGCPPAAAAAVVVTLSPRTPVAPAARASKKRTATPGAQIVAAFQHAMGSIAAMAVPAASPATVILPVHVPPYVAANYVDLDAIINAASFGNAEVAASVKASLVVNGLPVIDALYLVSSEVQLQSYVGAAMFTGSMLWGLLQARTVWNAGAAARAASDDARAAAEARGSEFGVRQQEAQRKAQAEDDEKKASKKLAVRAKAATESAAAAAPAAAVPAAPAADAAAPNRKRKLSAAAAAAAADESILSPGQGG